VVHIEYSVTVTTGHTKIVNTQSQHLTDSVGTLSFLCMLHRIIINKGIRDGSGIDDLAAELTMPARDLLQAILQALPDGQWEITGQSLVDALERGGVIEFDNTLQDSLRELVDTGCIRLARVRESGHLAA
jgi:hypothetical protein